MGSGVRRLALDCAEETTWDVTDARGRLLVRCLPIAQIRARVASGLLPGDAFVSRASGGDRRPLAHVVEVGRTKWWVARGAKVVGPVEIERIARGIQAGVVPLDALACRTGDKGWRPLHSIAELSRFVAERHFEEEQTGRIELGDASSW